MIAACQQCSFRGQGAFRDEFVMRDSYNMDAHHHHAATVHGMLHCRGGYPLRQGQRCRVDFGEMKGHIGVITDMSSNPHTREHLVTVVGHDPYGNAWTEELGARRNEFGAFVFPLHQV